MGLAGWYRHSGEQREKTRGRRGQKGRKKRSRKIKGRRQVQLMEEEKRPRKKRGLGVSLGPNLPVLEREPKHVIVKDPGKAVNAFRMFVFLPANP